MYLGKKILCIIPAREGSKGLPGKNTKIIYGKPLITWTTEKAITSKLIDEIFISTDSKTILEISKNSGIEVPYLRPSEYAADKSPIIESIIHTLNFFNNRNEKFDVVILLEPTSPLRKRDDVDSSIKSLIDNYEIADSLVTLGEIHLESPYIAKQIINGFVEPFIKSETIYQRQQLISSFFPYGVAYISKAFELVKEKTFYQKKTIPFFIERWQNYEIDDIYDFKCVETILKEKIGEIE